MGLNPSCNLDKGLKGFPNLGDPPFPSERKDIALAELLEAGLPRGSSSFTTKEIEIYKPDSEAGKLARSGISFPGACARSETMWITVHGVEAAAFGWKFRRAWYYWVVSTERHPVPLALATKLNDQHGAYVRTDGYAGGKIPKGDVDSYHVDTPAGLKVLVEVLKQEHDRREAEREAEYQRKYGR